MLLLVAMVAALHPLPVADYHPARIIPTGVRAKRAAGDTIVTTISPVKFASKRRTS